jgi:hypothetical protein
MKTKDAAGAIRIYNVLRVDGDRTTLVGPGHTDLSEDKFIINQRAPIAQKVYPGARKNSCAYILGAVSKEAGVDVRRPLRVDLSTSHTAGYTKEVVAEAVLRCVNVFLQDAQLEDYIFLGKRPA